MSIIELAGFGSRVESNSKLSDVDPDAFGCILGKIRIVGEYHCHRLADIPHALLSENGLPIWGKALDAREAKINGWNVRDIASRPDRDHTGRTGCLASV